MQTLLNLKKIVFSQGFIHRHRKSENDFIRKGKMRDIVKGDMKNDLSTSFRFILSSFRTYLQISRSSVFDMSKTLQDTNMSNVRGVLFDVDGTLYHQNCLRFIVAIHFAMYVLIRPFKTLKEIRIVRSYRSAQEWLREKNAPSVPLTSNAQLDRTVMATGISSEEVSLCVNEWMKKLPLRFLSLCSRKWLIRLIHCWDRLGVPMGVYSDYQAKDKLEELGLKNKMHIVVCSEDIDVRSLKPDPRGFEVAAAKMGLNPSQVVYIGDREDVDAVGALNAGMTPIIVKRSKKNNMILKPKLMLAILDRQLKEIRAVKGCLSQER